MSISSCFKNPHPPSPFPFSVYPHIICQLLFLRFLESTYIQVCFPLLTLFMLFKISKPYVIEFGSILKLNVMGCYVFGHVVESSLDIFTTLDSSTERWLLCTEFTSDIMMVNSLLCRLTFTLFFPVILNSCKNWRGYIIGSWYRCGYWWNCCCWKQSFIDACKSISFLVVFLLFDGRTV